MESLKKIIIIFCFAILFLVQVNLVSANTLELELLTINETQIKKGIVEYEAFSNKGTIRATTTIQEGYINITTFQEIQTINLFIIEENNEVPSFKGSITLNPQNTQRTVVYMQEVGSLKVYLNNIRFDDVIRVKCNQEEYQIYVANKETKIAKINNLDVSACLVRATKGTQFFNQEINVLKGKIKEVYFDVEQETETNITNFLSATIIFFIIVLIIILYTKKQENKKENPFKFLSKEKQDVIKFLKDKEFVNQAKIIYECKIPKTTLARILNDLEQKNILEIEKIGKSKRIKLKEEYK
ncbi:MAG: helix-turn-helix transcriptional regulator [Candidatus Woesearchaeota archaeon]